MAAPPIFVVQRHSARQLHYDLRLERDGALASWAVPKGIPLEPGAQHLALLGIPDVINRVENLLVFHGGTLSVPPRIARAAHRAG